MTNSSLAGKLACEPQMLRHKNNYRILFTISMLFVFLIPIIMKKKEVLSMGTFGEAKQTFTFSGVPKSAEELAALPEASLASPFQTAALTVLALCRYCQDRQVGIDMLNFLKGPQPLSPYEQQFLQDRLGGKPYLPYSFFAGSTPQNNYEPALPLTIIVQEDPYSYAEDGYAKLLLQSSGADQARPVKLRCKSQTQWFLWEQFLLSDIRQPSAADPWA